MRAYQFMVTLEKNSRKSAWLEERRIDRIMREDDKQELDASTSDTSEKLSDELKEVSPYVNAQGLGVGDIVIISSQQCEADYPMHFAVYNVIPGELILIPFNNYSEPAGTFEIKMFHSANPFARVLVTNALFTCNPAKLKCWFAGKLEPKDVSLMRSMVKHQMAGTELSELAKLQQGCFAGDIYKPKEFIEYSNELHIIINRLMLPIQCI